MSVIQILTCTEKFIALLLAEPRLCLGSRYISVLHNAPGHILNIACHSIGLANLMLKIFGSDDRQALDFLAHTLAVPMDEVPEIKSWDDALTVDMVSSIIDGLQPMYKGKGKGGF